MKLIIDISEKAYKLRLTNPVWYDSNMDKAIRNGIPLPKGHGRLIDENDVIKIHDNDDRVWWENALDDIKEFVPTIIEADTESEK